MRLHETTGRNGPGDRKPPAGRTTEGIPGNNNVADNHHSTARGRHSDLELPTPPILSPIGQAVVSADRGCRVVKSSPPAACPEPHTPPSVSAELDIYLGDLTCRTPDVGGEVARRFANVLPAPRGTRVNVHVRRDSRRAVWFDAAFAGWPYPLPELHFVIRGPDSVTARRAVNDLRRAIDLANQPPPVWTGEWPNEDLGATG